MRRAAAVALASLLLFGQALATQVSDTIGVVVMDVSDAFFGALVKAVDTVAQ